MLDKCHCLLTLQQWGGFELGRRLFRATCRKQFQNLFCNEFLEALVWDGSFETRFKPWCWCSENVENFGGWIFALSLSGNMKCCDFLGRGSKGGGDGGGC